MIGYLLKNWKLLLDLILVVGGIIAMAIFDPFGLFTNVRLKSTANLVSSIRDIGELTTAEYYGEVVSSLHEAKIHNVPADLLYETFEECYIDLRRAVAHTLLMERKIKRKSWQKVDKGNTIQEIRTLYDSADSNKIYSSLLTFLAVNNLKGATKDYYDLKGIKIKPDTENKILQWLTDDFSSFRKGLKKDFEDISDIDLEAFIFDLPVNFTGITSFHFRLKEQRIQARKKTRKQDIVFIGRGWVKAGFRFGQLDESNFYYDKEEKVIQFFGLTPCVLDKDINPWFIPEEKIKGFELVNYHNKSSFEEAVEVKKKCKEKLLKQAHKADILDVARRNGQESLRDFFSLLLNEPNLKVELLDFPFAVEFEMIAADTLVTIDEALIVKRIYDDIRMDKNQTLSEYDRETNAFRVFLNRLKQLSFLNDNYKFSLLSMDAANILQHALFVTPFDFEKVKSRRHALVSNGAGGLETQYMSELGYYEDYNSFIYDFNQMLKAIDEGLSASAYLREDTLYLSEHQLSTLQLNLDKEFFSVKKVITGDTLTKIHHKEVLPPVFAALHYPILNLHAEWFEDITLFKVDTLKTIMLSRNKQPVLDSIGNTSLKMLLENDFNAMVKVKCDSVTRSIQLKPIRSFTVGLKNLVQ